jgi:hypothetical protein
MTNYYVIYHPGDIGQPLGPMRTIDLVRQRVCLHLCRDENLTHADIYEDTLNDLKFIERVARAQCGCGDKITDAEPQR